MRVCREATRERGLVLVLMAVLLVGIIGLMALAVDVGYLYVVQADLQTAADAAALAGASGLSISAEEARRRAAAYARKNHAGGSAVILAESDVEILTAPGSGADSVRVTAQRRRDRGTAVGLFLARALGITSMDVAAVATATFGPRDVMLSLDYSASMSYDSQLRHVGDEHLDVVGSLRAIWQALGSPTYGTMDFDHPRTIPSSTSDSEIRRLLGLDDSQGHHLVPYPYPNSAYMDPSTWKVRTWTRDWSDYFRYVQGKEVAQNGNKTVVNDSRYRNVYSCRTFMDYLQAVQFRATPDAVALAGTPQQPLQAVKDAVSLFLDYMEHPRTDDRVGLACFTATDGTGKLEIALTTNYASIEAISQARQAGHYHNQTNIAAGIERARTELRTQGRSGAQHLIVLLSDGHANWIDNDHAVDETAAKRNALDQATLAARDKLRILTISLGAEADTALMQSIADITGGTHFIVPGGQSVSAYRERLLRVFEKIALQRPLKLIY